MEVKDMTSEDIELRIQQIEEELKSEGADIDTLETEVTALEARKADIKAQAEVRKKEVEEVLRTSQGVDMPGDKEINMEEIRNSKQYIDAYAEFVKTGKDEECRALLTENVSGTIPIPELVYDIVKTAWDKEGLMALVKKTYLKGNLKVGFEISGEDAVVHTEGGSAISAETLVEGIVTMVPASIKKMVEISDEVYDMRGEEFLRYIYEEISYRIAKKAIDLLLAKIVSCGTQSTTTCVGVPVYTSTTVSIDLTAQAIGMLSDEANDPVVVMNKATWAAFKAAQYNANYAVDPFEGLHVYFNNSLKSFSAASTGDTFMIVGDFANGALANMPNGDDITFKFDDMTKKDSDLIQVLGRKYVAIEPIAPNHFVKIVK